MKPIYKSLALASMTLQISLALNAETRDDESASTIALQAELLDSLRVELVAQNVSGARNLIESGECVINGSNLVIALDTGEWTRGAMYRVQVLATFGTQTQVIYALNVTVPYYIALSDVPQEFEDNVTIVSTITDVTEADLEGLALEETSQEIKAAITPISAAAEAYNVGKTQLAAAITSKGVETSPTESYPEMAEKVAQIPQETTIYEGADSYGKQIGAGGSLWDLYQVLADMKTRFMGTGDYAALIVCEYYKSYDSLVLQGADGYYTCDGDYYDYASPTHVWHDDNNGKMNRWVAFLYRQAGARLDITNTAISPQSMYIGGHIGTIEYFVNGRLTELVCGVEETDFVDNFITSGFSQDWNKSVILRKINHYKSEFSIEGAKCVVIESGEDSLSTSAANFFKTSNENLFVEIKGNIHPIASESTIISVNNNNGPEYISIPDLEELQGSGHAVRCINGGLGIKKIYAENLRSCDSTSIFIRNRSGNDAFKNLDDVMIGVMISNLYAKDWNPTNVLADATKKAQLIENIKNHILARVSDATGGTQLVFTISTNMYNAVASETIEWKGETMSLADAFLTKNWLLAGA